MAVREAVEEVKTRGTKAEEHLVREKPGGEPHIDTPEMFIEACERQLKFLENPSFDPLGEQ